MIEEIQNRVNEGLSIESNIKYMYDADTSIMESIKIIRKVYSISLGEAKKLVSTQPCWMETVDKNKPLHDACEQILNRDE